MTPIAVMLMKSGGASEYTAAESTADWVAGSPSGTCIPSSGSAARVVAKTANGGTFEFPSVLPAAAPSATKPKSVVRYRTFLPDAFVSAPAIACDWGASRFKGDNRGFSNYYSARNRSRASVFFDWTKKKISTSKHIGTTHQVDGNGNTIRSKTASASGIRFQGGMISASYGRIEISHSVKNPLCWSAGPISYGVVIERWQTGGTRISGRLVRVPNHEAIVFPSSQTTGSEIFRRTGWALICLNIVCGAGESIRVTSRI